jgi:hypothetical protein
LKKTFAWSAGGKNENTFGKSGWKSCDTFVEDYDGRSTVPIYAASSTS